MPNRRFPSRFHAGAIASAAALAVLASAEPRVDAQAVGRRDPGARPPAEGVTQDPQQAVTPRVRLTAERAEAFVDAEERGLDYLPGEVIVKFKPGMTPVQQQRALMALRSRPDVSDLEWHTGFAVLRDQTQPNARILAQQLSEQPEVDYAEPNYIAKIQPGWTDRVLATVPRTPTRVLGVPNDADYPSYQWNFALINMPGAWDIQPGASADVIVAVVDTGITVVTQTMTFPLWTGSTFQNVPMAFDSNRDLPVSRLVSPRDFVFFDPEGPVLDMDGHGSHVSSTIAESTNNGTLVAGIAYNARIMPVKVCTSYWEVMIARARAGTTGFAAANAGGCPFADIADGIQYAAENGAKVINISLGGPGQSTTVRNALTFAVGRGAFVSISMGNDFESGNEISYPARYAQDIDGVVAVAAIGKTENRAFYSSTGLHCEIAAPGGDSRVGGSPDLGRIWQSTLLASDQVPSVITPRFDRYDKVGYTGTSMASPHVAGLAALLVAQSPGIAPASIERIIRMTAKDLGAAGKDESFGDGLIQPRIALFGRGIRR